MVFPDTIQVSNREILSSDQQRKIRLQIYQSTNFLPPSVLLYFHGGGYVVGLPEQADAQMILIAENLKTTVISVDYRLSPQYPYPAAIEDGFDTFQWLIDEGEKTFGVCPNRITVYGASAGGHLAGSLAQLTAIQGLHQINHQFLLYPVINFRLDSDSMHDLADAPIWKKEHAEVSRQHFLAETLISKHPSIAGIDRFRKLHQLSHTTLVACELESLKLCSTPSSYFVRR